MVIRTSPPPLVATKLGIQVRVRDIVSRPRLEDLLSGADSARLVLVSAPAGYGKTTLVAEWLLSRGAAFAWLTLDAADNDPARFLRYLDRAVGESDADDGAKGRSRAVPSREGVLSAIVDRAARSAGFVIVLDDYHLIADSEVHAAVTELIERLPAAARLVITTRVDPPLPLARLRARRELLEIRADALRFTAGEALAFLTGPMALELMADDVDRLVERTEGWVAALQLAAVSLRGRTDHEALVRAFSASNRFILDFVLDEILSATPDDVQEFLLRTSVLDRLCAPLCEALTETDGAQAVLERLERSNLLVFPQDDERRWYRYHQLFADLLRARLLSRSPSLPQALHARAARWLEGNDEVDGAIEHALRGSDPRHAVRLIRSRWMAIMHASELRTVERWLDALPPDLLRADAQLCATYAWGRVLRGESDGVEERLADAEVALLRDEVEPVDRLLVPSQLESIRALLAEQRGDGPAEVRHARAAIALVPEGLDPSLDALLKGDATSLLGHGYLLQGDDASAAEAFGRSWPLLSRGGNHLGVSHAARDLARIELRAGRPRDALEVCDRALREAPPDALAAYAAVHVARGEALAAAGRREEARAAADRAVEVWRTGGDETAIRDARALASRLDPTPADAARHPSSSPAGRRHVEPNLPERPTLVERLTPRELEVLRLVAAGRSNRQIAAELFVTLGTVKTHVHAIAGKLGAANRVEAIVRARDAGLID